MTLSDFLKTSVKLAGLTIIELADYALTLSKRRCEDTVKNLMFLKNV